MAAILAGFGLLGVLLALLAASAVRVGISWALCHKLGGRPRISSNFGPWLSAALPFAAFELALAAYLEAPTLALYWMSGSEQTGWFSAAYRAVGFALIAPLALEAAIYPVLAGMDGATVEMRKAYIAGLRFVLFLTAAGAMLVFGFSAQLTEILFGAGYDSTPLMVLSVVMPLSAANALTRGYLWSSDRQRAAARNMALAAAILIAILYPLVDRYGANGAAGALVVAEGALLGLNLASADVKNLAWKLWPHAAAASAGISACYTLYIFTENGVPLWAMGAVCAAVHVVVLVALKGLRKRELQAIWGSFGK